MVKGISGVNFILLHVYDKPDEKDEAEFLINRLNDELVGNHGVTTEIRLEKGGNIIDTIERTVRHTDAQLVVMGFAGKARLELTSIGSNTLKMVERNICPILVIPPTAHFFEIKNACLLSDFKEVEQS